VTERRNCVFDFLYNFYAICWHGRTALYIVGLLGLISNHWASNVRQITPNEVGFRLYMLLSAYQLVSL